MTELNEPWMLVLIIQKVNCYIFELKMAIFVHHILKYTFCAQNDSFCTSHSQTYIFSSKWACLYITFFLLPNSSIIICKHYECYCDSRMCRCSWFVCIDGGYQISSAASQGPPKSRKARKCIRGPYTFKRKTIQVYPLIFFLSEFKENVL